MHAKILISCSIIQPYPTPICSESSARACIDPTTAVPIVPLRRVEQAECYTCKDPTTTDGTTTTAAAALITTTNYYYCCSNY